MPPMCRGIVSDKEREAQEAYLALVHQGREEEPEPSAEEVEAAARELQLPGMCPEDAVRVHRAHAKGESITGYMDNDLALRAVMLNWECLQRRGTLEISWMTAYMHADHFADIALDELQQMFDRCDRAALKGRYPIPKGDHFSNGQRFSLFRGVAGPNHRMGMSWTWSLDKAIWYATQHVEHRGLTGPTVYAAAVDCSEIYCCGEHYEWEFIVRPRDWWKVNVPAAEFRLDRPR